MKRSSRRAVLSISNLSVERDGTSILKDVAWRVNPGEHWVILGANGSGKTSLLSVLTGYLTPTAGHIEVLGQVFGESEWRELRKQIGLVSSSIRQMIPDYEPAIDTVVSGKYAMIDFWGTPSRADYRQASAILKQIECDYLKDRPWGFLSQGERQRILIGRALMAKPALLILDEPCAGLDPVAREHFLQFLQRLGKRRKPPTLVLVTHHVEEIMPVFTHVLLLKDGMLFSAGEKSQLLSARTLGNVFGASVRLSRQTGRYHLSVKPNATVII
jgi:iron complex transport system ATP-binding protein